MPRRKPFGVAVIGEFFVDEILSGFHSLPKMGEETFARVFRRELGGGAAITACGLARLGVNVTAIGVVGKEDGRWVTDRLRARGVDCSGIEIHPDEATGLTVSVSTREDRAFFSYYGANEGLAPLLSQPATLELLSSTRHVHFACAPNPDTDAALFGALNRSRCRLSIDVQSHMSWLTRPESLNILRYCDIFFPNEQEGQWISAETSTPRILYSLKEKGLRGVGLKLGGKGAALLWRKREFLADPYLVETVDTTGAGDCFDAGFIYAWLNGERPQQCLEIANICGALSTRALGGIDAFPSLDELRDCLDEQKVAS
jgi:sugar/nucleoside kinase (ribokinase family)